MHAYVVEELPSLLEAELPLSRARGISGHSMGGHGALVAALRHPGHYRSLSALAPICHPTACPWGQKAFGAYLGSDRQAWAAWDATLLIAAAPERLPLLVDQGSADPFLEAQLRPADLAAAAERAGHPLELRYQEGYDHSYFFIASFIEDHLRHHAAALLG
jgi:S-formylglutathione hydrolase